MKKVFSLLLLTMMATTFTPQNMVANNGESTSITTNPTNPEMPERVKVLLTRVDEIRAMDKSTLTRVERKELRKELRAINTELKSTGNGIYLSIGAIIIIILLLILIL